MGWNLSSMFRNVFFSNVDGSTRKRVKHVLLLGNRAGQVTEMTVAKAFGTDIHISICFKIVMEKDKAGP